MKRSLLVSLVFAVLIGQIGVAGKVVQDFSNCIDSFYGFTPPSVNLNQNYARICQNLEGNFYFATLYDSKRKIPRYSAYRISLQLKHLGEEIFGRKSTWYIEPQLSDPNGGDSMQTYGELNNCNKAKHNNPLYLAIFNTQATSDDYDDSL